MNHLRGTMKKKIVYVVMGGWDWEGNEIVSVHHDKIHALLARDMARNGGHPNHYDYVNVEEHEVQP
jgi:hypothetical protein